MPAILTAKSQPEEIQLVQIIIRNLDDTVLERLRARALAHGCSLEQELRDVLVDAAEKTDDLVEELAVVRALTIKRPRRLGRELLHEEHRDR
ncbi:MAG: hypothetical protein P4M00_18505 [Azospirillaceae bacterium]|nr:hypothetical protein [Azospirillaceae bacterium]